MNAAPIPNMVNRAVATRLVEATADLAWVVDDDGIIQNVLTGQQAQHPSWQRLVGRRWVETVHADSRAKVEALLADARGETNPRPREINQLGPDAAGKAVPFRFSAAPIDDTRLLALGRDLSQISELQQEMLNAQQASDREYMRVRHAETRYRTLFQLSGEAVLLVDMNTLRLVEHNPHAAESLAELLGGASTTLMDLIAPESVAVVEQMVAAARAGQTTEAVRLSLIDERSVLMATRHLRQGPRSYIIVQLRDVEGDYRELSARGAHLLSLAESIPDGLVAIDADAVILAVNGAFCELVGLPNESSAVGEHLARWLGRSGVETNILLENLRAHGIVLNFATTISPDHGEPLEASVSAGGHTEGPDAIYGISIRTAQGRLALRRATEELLPNSAEQLAGLVGQVPLKEIVRTSSDQVERLCIEAALELTNDNRASAAQLLGLSRQSLYSKLRRFGIVTS